jgi:hypothetical protein
MSGEGNEAERARWIAWLEQKIKRAPIASILVTHHGRNVDRFEIDAGNEGGETTEAFGARIWSDLEADASALGGDGGPEIYMALLFREAGGSGRESADSPTAGAEATRPLRVHSLDADPVHFGGDSERAQSFRHSERFAQILAQTTSVALDRADRENDRLIARQAREDDRRWEDLERARRVALDQSELELKKEEARMQTLFMEQCFGQLSLLAPLILSKILGGDETPGGAVERRMLKDFLATLGDPEKTAIFGVLDNVQRVALGSLVQGDVDPKFEAMMLSNLMASVTVDQLNAVHDICQTPEQKAAFARIFEQRKKGLTYAANMAKLAAAPGSLAPAGTHPGDPSDPPNGSVS